MKILIATHPFSRISPEPMSLIIDEADIISNPYNRRLKANEVSELIKDVDIVIAGTEPYHDALKNSNIKCICRVGIGLDNIPLDYCRENNIAVSYTPDAPSKAVAELTVANIINLTRHILPAHRNFSKWTRYMGRRMDELTIGIIGMGRIGKIVYSLLKPFGCNILCNDIREIKGHMLVDAYYIFKYSDVVTIHIPGGDNINYLNRQKLELMKPGSYIINTSRGRVVSEPDLVYALSTKLGGAALDVFTDEPYSGPLTMLKNVILTPHIAASTEASRYQMELEASTDCLNFIYGRPLINDAL